MARSKESWLREGAGDLREADVEDVPVEGESVRVRGLPAAYSNQAISEALESKTIGTTQIQTVNKGRLEVLQFAHGCVDPQFSVDEAQHIAEHFGPAFTKVIAKIDELSGTDKEAIDEANARFQGGRNGKADTGEAGLPATPGGDGGPNIPARVGAGDGEDGPGADLG